MMQCALSACLALLWCGSAVGIDMAEKSEKDFLTALESGEFSAIKQATQQGGFSFGGIENFLNKSRAVPPLILVMQGEKKRTDDDIKTIVAYLIGFGADINAEYYGETPLFTALDKNLSATAEYLLDRQGVDVQKASRRTGKTPLHIACEKEGEAYKKLAEGLIKAGARLDVKDGAGKMPGEGKDVGTDMKKLMEDKRKELADQKRLEEGKKLLEEQKKRKEQKKIEEQEKLLEEQKKLFEEQKKLFEEQKKREEQKKIEEQKKKLAEQEELDRKELEKALKDFALSCDTLLYSVG
jgi:hypothetical protein